MISGQLLVPIGFFINPTASTATQHRISSDLIVLYFRHGPCAVTKCRVHGTHPSGCDRRCDPSVLARYGVQQAQDILASALHSLCWKMGDAEMHVSCSLGVFRQPLLDLNLWKGCVIYIYIIYIIRIILSSLTTCGIVSMCIIIYIHTVCIYVY